jgi:two-component system response regulator NreC
LSRALVGEYLSEASGDEAATADGLTDREREVLRLVSQGHTGKEIAEGLEISPRTVDRHRQSLMAKLDLHTRAALIKYAVRKGLLDSDP